MITKKDIENLPNGIKLLVLFVDLALFAVYLSIIESLLLPIFGLEDLNTWSIVFLTYFLLFLIPEFYFNRTLGMKFFNVLIKNRRPGEINKNFITYSILVIFDRFLLIILLYFFRVFFYSNKNLLLSEKYSGLRWSK